MKIVICQLKEVKTVAANKKRKPRRQRIGYVRKIFSRPMFEEIARTQLYFDEFNDVMPG